MSILKKIILLCFLLIIFSFSFYYFNYISNKKFNHKLIKVEINKNYIYSKGELFFLQQDPYKNEAKFMTYDGTIIINISYDGNYESVKYNLIDDYLFFWLNGEPDKYSVNHNKRNNTLSRAYVYDLRKNILKELSYKNNDKKIIISIFKDGEDIVIAGEKVKDSTWNGEWKTSQLFINDEIYNFSIPYEKEFEGNIAVYNDSLYVTSYDGIYLLKSGIIEKIYDYDGIYYSKLYCFNDIFVLLLKNKIVILDNNLNLIKEIEFNFFGDYFIYQNNQKIYFFNNKSRIETNNNYYLDITNMSLQSLG